MLNYAVFFYQLNILKDGISPVYFNLILTVMDFIFRYKLILNALAWYIRFAYIFICINFYLFSLTLNQNNLKTTMAESSEIDTKIILIIINCS